MQPSHIDPQFTRGRNKIAATITFAHAIKHLCHSGHSSLIKPEIKIALALNRTQFGAMGTASHLVWWIATMISGYLGDRFSKRAGLMLFVSMTVMGGSLFLMGFAPGYVSILLITALSSIGYATFHPPAIGELSRIFPDRRGFAVSLHGMAANIGEVIGPPVVATLLSFMIWREILKISLLPVLLTAVAIWFLMPPRKTKDETETKSAQRYFSSILDLLHNRILLLLIITTALRSIGEAGITEFLPLYLREDLGYSPVTVALILSISQISGVISQPVMGILSDKIGRKPVVVSGTALTMLSGFALSIVQPGVQLFTTVLVRGALTLSLHHIVVAAAIDAAQGATQSTVVALIYGSGLLGTFSPYVAGIISDRHGIQSAFLYGGIILIIPTILLLTAKFPDHMKSFKESEQAQPRFKKFWK